MSTNQYPTPEDIEKAIRSSGYLMEQEVATLLEDMDFHVETNKAYKDLDEGKSREIDVYAITEVYRDEKNKILLFFELLCECKNSSSPFVFLTRPKHGYEKFRTPEELVFPQQRYSKSVKREDGYTVSREISALEHFDLVDEYYRNSSDKKAVQFAKIVMDKGKWVANHAGLYDSIFYPIAKATLSRKHDIIEMQNGSWKYVWVILPLLITSGDIYEIDSSQNEIKPTKVRHTSFTRSLKSEKINGDFSVDFVSKDDLVDFIKECPVPFIRKLKQTMIDKPELFNSKY